jgi:hypothetical protein
MNIYMQWKGKQQLYNAHVFLFSLFCALDNTGSFITFSVITNVYKRKTKGPTLLELFIATGELKKIFDN